MRPAPARARDLRPPRLQEQDAIVELLNEHGRAVHGTDAVTDADVRTWFENPIMDPERDMRVVEEGGVLLAYGDVNDGGPERSRYWIDLRLRPGVEADVGRELVEALEERARETAAAGALARAHVSSEDEAARAIFSARGYRLVRHSFRMEAKLGADAPSEPGWPEGITVRTFRSGEERRVHDVEEAAFADHWEFMPTPYEEWAHWQFRDGFDPQLWFLAEDGEELAGLCLCRLRESGQPDLGWVSVLAVGRPWRRRGLGLALLRHGIRELHARGQRRIGLGVDAENTTGAVRLYEHAGMGVVRRYDTLDRPL